MSSDRGPWTATRPVASDRSSSTARSPSRRSASASDTIRGVRRVGHDHEPLLGEAVHDQVVEDAAVGGADHRVVRAADGQRRRVRDERRGQRGARPPDPPRPARPCARGRTGRRRARTARCSSRMPGVLDRHQPAGELHDLRAQRLVAVEQRRGQRRGWSRSWLRLPRGRSRCRGTAVGRGRGGPGDQRPLRLERQQRRRPRRTRSSGPRRTRGRGVPGPRRWGPSGSSGRSCGCACRPGRTSSAIESKRPDDAGPRGRSPRATSRSAVSSVVSPGCGVPLGSVQVTPSRSRRRLPTTSCGAPSIEPDDDATGGGGGGLPQAGHAGATDERRGPPRAGASCVQGMTAAGCGRPLRDRAGRRDGERAPRRAQRGQRAHVGAAQHGAARRARPRRPRPGCRPSRRSRARADGWTNAPAMPRTGRRCCAACPHRTASGRPRKCGAEPFGSFR